MNDDSLTLTRDEANLIIGALDSLGVALADHRHQWSDGERAIYEEAVALLRGSLRESDG